MKDVLGLKLAENNDNIYDHLKGSRTIINRFLTILQKRNKASAPNANRSAGALTGWRGAESSCWPRRRSRRTEKRRRSADQPAELQRLGFHIASTDPSVQEAV